MVNIILFATWYHILNRIPPEFAAFFHQHFLVHEFEALLFSEPAIFPSGVAIPDNLSSRPEEIDFDAPPSKRLKNLYSHAFGNRFGYVKGSTGVRLFPQLAPDTIYMKCPYFKEFMDDLLETAKKGFAEQ
jgi:hypothetical protein